MMPRLRRALPTLLVLGACLALVFPIALGRSFFLRDVLEFTYPMKAYLRERLLAGELPLWNPRMGLGRPFFGLVQPGVLYPGNLLLLLPLPLGFDLFTAAHLVVCALGMRAWLRRLLPGDEVAPALGGVVLALSGWYVSLLVGNGVYAFGNAWVPWVLAVAARGQPGPGRAAKVGLALALCLSAGDPQAVWLAVVLALVQAAAAPTWRARGAQAATVLGGAALAGLVMAVQLLPGLEAARVGRPGGVPFEDAQHFALHPARLVEVFWPGAYGAPFTAGWFVHALVDEGTGSGYEPLAAGIYVGLATPILAAWAVVRRERRALDVALAACALFFLVVALGTHGPLFRVFFHVVPGAKLFRYPEKYLFASTVCAAALGARGLQHASERPRRAAAVFAVTLGVLAALAVCATRWGAPLARALVGRLGAVTPEAAGRTLAGRALAACPIAAATLVPLVLAARGRLSAGTLRAVLAAIIGVDLVAASLALVVWTPSRTYTIRPPIVEDLAAAGGLSPTERLYRPQLLDLTGGTDLALMKRLTLRPNTGAELGVSHLDAYDVFRPEPERRLWTALRAQPLRLLRLAATRFGLLGDGQLRGAHPGIEILKPYPAVRANLVTIAGAAPRAWLATSARPVRDLDEAAAAVAAPDWPDWPDGAALVEGGEGGEPRTASGSCHLETYAPETIQLACTADAPAYAVVADGHFPGWQATVDGAAAPVLRANVAFRAVPIPAGTHTVTLRYRPFGLRAGLALSLLGVALCAFLIVRSRVRP